MSEDDMVLADGIEWEIIAFDPDSDEIRFLESVRLPMGAVYREFNLPPELVTGDATRRGTL